MGFNKGHPVCYRNVRVIDLSDNTDLEVDIVWRSSEMKLYNLFEACDEKRSAQQVHEARVCGKLNTIKELE